MNGFDVLGMDRRPDGLPWQQVLVGTYDIAGTAKQMNTLKQVTVGIARSLLAGGQTAINWARNTATAKSLPNPTPRDNVYWKLDWHQKALATAGADTSIYASGADLKKWVMQAFIEANAVEEGAAAVDAAWAQMWKEIKDKLAAIPAAIREVVLDTAGGVFQAVTGVPLWVLWVGGAAVLGLVGFVAYKVVTGPVGGAVVKRYLP